MHGERIQVREKDVGGSEGKIEVEAPEAKS